MAGGDHIVIVLKKRFFVLSKKEAIITGNVLSSSQCLK